MDIFGSDIKQRLDEYRTLPLLFTPLENTTNTVGGQLSNVQHHEAELTPLLSCEGDVIRIDSNYGHHVLLGFEEKPPVRKSNRGRKKKPKPPKTRKCQGDGTKFNSQIMFTVLGKVRRTKRHYPDNHSKNAVLEKDEETGQIYEVFTKEYKILVFRQGSFTITGSLVEDFSDVRGALKSLCAYFSEFFLENVEVISLKSNTRNYKFRTNKGKIDLRKLYLYCVLHLKSLLKTNFEDIAEYLNNPLTSNWEEPDYEHLASYLQNVKGSKSLYIDFQHLRELIQEIRISEIYQKVNNFVEFIRETYFIDFNHLTVKLLTQHLTTPHLKKLQESLIQTKDNKVSNAQYDPERYSALLLRIKIPAPDKPTKKATVKIMASGKINIDGLNTPAEAEFIYHWLNKFFIDHPEFLYHEKDMLNLEHDPEFSDSDSEEDSK